MNFLQKLIFISFICIGISPYVLAQNPFDIKKPDKSSNTSKPVNKPSAPVEKEKTTTVTPPPPPPQTNQSSSATPAGKENTSSNTLQTNPNQPSTSALNTTSTNPFEIKAGATNQTIINNTPPTNNQTTNNPNNTNNQTIHQNAEPETKGLEGVENPFVIKPGENPSQANPENAVASPSINDIKDQISEFKNTTTQSESRISKNMWFIIYLFLFLLAAVAINFNRSYPLALIKATYNQNQMRMLYKDAFKGNHSFIFLILYFLFIINGGIFLYHSFHLFSIHSISLIQSIGIIFLIYLIRHFVLFVMGVIFPISKETGLFNYTISIYNLALGIILLLLNVVLSFVDVETGKMLVFSGLSLILVLYILRQARGLLISMQTVVSAKFHFIIYLCTVEIAPWLLLSGIILR